jgi:Ca2+-transporting ATPase
MQAWSIRQGLPHWQTMAFTVLCFSQLGLALAIRSRRESIFSLGLLSNKPMLGAVALTTALHLLIIYVPFGNRLFSTQRLTVAELSITLVLSSLVFWAVELQKLIVRRRGVAVTISLSASTARLSPKPGTLAPA